MIKPGRAWRLARLTKCEERPLFIVPLDHTVTDGPFTDARGYDELLVNLAKNGVDAIVVHKGRLGLLPADVYAKLSVIVHISASTKYAADPTFKYQVGDVEDCLRRERRRCQRSCQCRLAHRRPSTEPDGPSCRCLRPRGTSAVGDALSSRSGHQGSCTAGDSPSRRFVGGRPWSGHREVAAQRPRQRHEARHRIYVRFRWLRQEETKLPIANLSHSSLT